MGFIQNKSIFKNIFSLITITILISLANYDLALAQKPNYPVGNPTGLAGTGNAITDSDNFFMRNNIAGLTEIPLSSKEDLTRNKTDFIKGRWRFNGELQLLAFRQIEKPFLGADTISKGNSLTPNFAAEITYTSSNHRFGFGASAYQVINFNNRLLNKQTLNTSEVRFINTDITLGAALRLSKKLSIGAGIIFSRGSALRATEYSNFLEQREIDGFGGLGAVVGIHYRPTKYLSFGTNYKSRRTNRLFGEERFSLKPRNSPLVKQDSFTDIDIGTTLEIGVEIKPHHKVLLACDFRYFDYSIESRNPGVLGDLRDVQSFYGGVKYSLTAKTTAMFGLTTSCQNGRDECARARRGAIGLGISGGFNYNFAANKALSLAFTAFPGDTEKRPFFENFGISKERGFLISLGLQTRS